MGTVPNAMTTPSFGLFTLGVNSGGGTARFDYFEVDGARGCEEPEPENRRPVIASAQASPTLGYAPLAANFTASASDPDEDELTYSWDFGDGSPASTQQNPSHTYQAPGEYDAVLTVSDGELTATRTVRVQVLDDADPEARFRVLVFSKTTGFRHDSIDEGHAAIEALGDEHAFQVDHTEDATAFRDAVLRNYDTVVFLSTTGDPLNDTQQRAFERYIQAGGGYTGIHAAADTEYDWNWYGHLVGGYFLSHPPGTTTRRDGRSTSRTGRTTRRAHLPARWNRVDEWYNYRSPDYQDPDVPDGDYSPRSGGVHVLATMDELTYEEGDGNDPVADDHPISWCQRYDGGRSWYTGIGHTAESFSEADYLEHILGGIEVSAGAAGSDECGVPEPGNAPPTVVADGRPALGPGAAGRGVLGHTAPTRTVTSSRTRGTSATAARRCARTRTTRTSSRARTWRRSRSGTRRAPPAPPRVEIIVTDPPGNKRADRRGGRRPDRGQAAAGGAVLGLRVRSRRRSADLRLGLRRRREVVPPEPEPYVHDGGDVHRDGHRDRHEGRHRDRHGGGDRGQPRADRRADGDAAVRHGAAERDASRPRASDPDGDALTYQFDFGEGKPTKAGNATDRHAQVHQGRRLHRQGDRHRHRRRDGHRRGADHGDEEVAPVLRRSRPWNLASRSACGRSATPGVTRSAARRASP